MDPDKERFAQPTEARTLTEIIGGADVFLGLSAAGALKQDMVVKMGDRPLVFALANPTPEIMPEEVKAVRPRAVRGARLATGPVRCARERSAEVRSGPVSARARCV